MDAEVQTDAAMDASVTETVAEGANTGIVEPQVQIGVVETTAAETQAQSTATEMQMPIDMPEAQPVSGAPLVTHTQPDDGSRPTVREAGRRDAPPDVGPYVAEEEQTEFARLERKMRLMLPTKLCGADPPLEPKAFKCEPFERLADCRLRLLRGCPRHGNAGKTGDPQVCWKCLEDSRALKGGYGATKERATLTELQEALYPLLDPLNANRNQVEALVIQESLGRPRVAGGRRGSLHFWIEGQPRERIRSLLDYLSQSDLCKL